MAAHLLFSHEDEGGEATGGHVSTEWWRDEEERRVGGDQKRGCVVCVWMEVHRRMLQW